MKRLTYISKKNVTLSILITAFFIISAAKPLSKTNFTGNWTINLQKSEFNGAPQFTAPKQLKVLQNSDQLEIEALITGNLGSDSTMKERLSFDKPSIIKTSDQRTRRYQMAWAAENLKVDYSSSYSNDPGKEEYHTTELWTLASDGKSLMVEKEVQVVSGYSYKIKAVYDKK